MMDIHKGKRLQKKAEKETEKQLTRKYKENDWIYIRRREGQKNWSSISLYHR